MDYLKDRLKTFSSPEYKEKVTYLNQYLYSKASLESLLQEREKWFTIGTKVNSVSDGMPHSPSINSKVESSSIKMLELTQKIDAEVHNLEKTMDVIEKIIDNIEDFKGQAIFRFRYINGMSFAKIAEVMGFSERHVFDVHKKILMNLDIKIDKEKVE